MAIDSTHDVVFTRTRKIHCDVDATIINKSQREGIEVIVLFNGETLNHTTQLLLDTCKKCL